MTNSESRAFELKRVGPECFSDFYALLEESFIPEEIRSPADALAILDNPDFILYNIICAGKSAGYISVWRLEELTFVEHFVMRPDLRGQGYGEKAISMLSLMHGALVLECEPREDEMKRRRAAFYERCGFVENDIAYTQPSYREGFPEVPLMLMSTAGALSDPQKTVKDIYIKVYRRDI